MEGLAMPLPKRLARFNTRVTNRLTGRVAGRLPGFGIVSHVGRRSGRAYRTPVNVFREGEQYVFALTYGPDADWVRNVLAAGGCRLETRGRTVELRDPERFNDPTRHLVPLPVRWALGLIRVDEFLTLHPGSWARRGHASRPEPS
jgi:deazaflavin-dependent oxidoreductase (nitroreductase family)